MGIYFGIVLSGESVPRGRREEDRELELWFGWDEMEIRKV